MTLTSRQWLLVAVLVVLNLVVFGQVVTHDFLNYDDGQFITENRAVQSGDIGWALTSAKIGWYPLTWLSHMLDWKVWGANAGGHLATNVVLHLLSTLLLFFALRELTGKDGRSAFVAALFAIHPMHVESVAWAAERKDTLSTVFIMLALFLYARAKRATFGVTIAMGLSLLAKQMYVTFPFVLLLLDWWPLARLNRRAVTEKIPLFVLTLAGTAAAIVGQRNLSAMHSVASLPLWDRVANASVGYWRYIGKLFVPNDLAVLYPRVAIETSTVWLAIIGLLLVSAAAWLLRQRAPYFLTGWLWFLGTLVPVIGFVQIGGQAIADRYTYFSYIGLFIVLAWAIVELVRVPVAAYAAAASAAVVILAFVAFQQTARWKNTETLFTHAINVTPPNALAHYSLGQSLELTDPQAAIQHLKESILILEPALRADPNAPRPDWYGSAFTGIGASLVVQAQKSPRVEEQAMILDSAATYFQRALQLDPNDGAAQKNLAMTRAMRAKLTTRVDPRAEASLLLDSGTSMSMQNRFPEAVRFFERAVKAAPEWPEARIYLGLGLMQAGRTREGIEALQEAQKLNPEEANAALSKALQMPANPKNLTAFIDRYSH